MFSKFHILIALLLIMFYLVWCITRMHRIVDHVIIDRKQLSNLSPFPTYVYNLLLSSVRTNNEIIAIDKQHYPANHNNNNWRQFRKHVLLGDINHIVLASRPYKISFRVENDKFIFINIKLECEVFKLGFCEHNGSKDSTITKNYNIDIDSLLTQFIHVLGYKI